MAGALPLVLFFFPPETANQSVLESCTLSDGFHAIVKIFLLKYEEMNAWLKCLCLFLTLAQHLPCQKLSTERKKRLTLCHMCGVPRF